MRPKEKVNKDIAPVRNSFEYKKQFDKNQITLNPLISSTDYLKERVFT